MNKQRFINDLINYINKQILGGGKIKVDQSTQLFEDRIINSMKIIELIALVEKKLKIKVEDDMITMENFKSVHTIAEKFYDYEKRKKTK